MEKAASMASAGRRARLVAMLAVAGALVLAGCGSSSKSSTSSPAAAPPESASSTPSGGGHQLSLSSNSEGQLKYSTTSLSAPAGTVTISFTNMAPLGHNVTVASASGQVLGATPTFQGGTRTLALSLKPGVYKFYCTVPGHRASGMEGTLTVGGASGGTSAGGASSETATSKKGGSGYAY